LAIVEPVTQLLPGFDPIMREFAGISGYSPVEFSGLVG
jgi:hypothetical protein